jgi:meso-butanediol dehydrogenase/(S,S)-butanediol dehydrogenase/diacetyl reductase
MQRFDGKTVLITGAAEGMGRAITLAFAREGAIVLPTDINLELLAKTAQDAAQLSGRPVDHFKLDVTKRADIEAVVKAIVEKHGRIDVLINNAGVSTHHRVVDLTDEEWDFCMNVNAKGVFLMTRAVLPHMIAAGGGKIVNTSSAAGKIGSPLEAHYSASKFAVLGFTKSVALDVAEHHINVNAVCPGIIKTSMQDREVAWDSKIRGVDPEDIRKMYVQYTPLGRIGQPEDVAKVVLFLASSDADFMTGQGINVTGGIIMH